MLPLPPSTGTVRTFGAKPPIPTGWIVLGVLLLPLTGLLIWANYALLVLGLEAAFGFKRITWSIVGVTVTAEQVVSLIWLIAEVLVGFFLAELLGWVDFLDLDDRLSPRQRWRSIWFIGLLFAALVAGEVSIGVYRQARMEEDFRLRERALHALTDAPAQSAPTTITDTMDLRRSAPEQAPGARTPHSPLSPAPDDHGLSQQWQRFTQSLPTAATVVVHVAAPCLSALGGIFAAPVFFFLVGGILSVLILVPLTLLIVPLELISGLLHTLCVVLGALLTVIAAPVRLLIEAFTAWTRRK